MSTPDGPALSAEGYRQLYDLARTLLGTDDHDAMLDQVVGQTLQLVGADRGFLVLASGDELSFKVVRNWSHEDLEERRDQVSRSIVQFVLSAGSPLVIPDAQLDDRFSDQASVINMQVRSVLAAPLRTGGNTKGVLYLEGHAPERPFSRQDLELFQQVLEIAGHLIEKGLEASRPRPGDALSPVLASFPFPGLMTRNPRFRKELETAAKVAGSELTVLVQGPSGTGKELIVRAIHEASARADRPLEILNCGAISPNLLESELFGHVKGAFTGAVRDRRGILAQSDGGTLFLDEIGELPVELQPKLLRALQSKRIRPVGAEAERQVDFRLLAATNRDLEEEIEAGRFREDLFYRINAITIAAPPLRERREDILPLFEHFLRKGRGEAEGLALSPEVTRALLIYPWPGNVRELENEALKLLALLGGEGTVVLRQLSERIAAAVRGVKPPTLEEAERAQILDHLRIASGNRSEAARTLGISREGLRKKMKRHGLE